MQHLVAPKALPRHAVSLVVCTTLVATPVSNAYASPLDGVVKFATASPLVTFGLGCAAGAVVGGLVVGLSGRSARRRLEEEIDEVVKTAERAEESARRAEAILAEHERKAQATNVLDPIKRAPAPASRASEAQPHASVSRVQNVPRSVPVVDVQGQVAQQQPQEPKQPSVDASTLQTNALDRDKIRQRSEAEKTSRGQGHARRRGLRATGKILDLPVIDRGAERPASESPFVVTRPRPRQFDPTVRANLIDRRVPRFDESLFPDTTNELHQDVDVFETAMRAMDATLSDTGPQAQIESQPTANLAKPTAEPTVKPEMNDTSSYVEYLVKDELERNRNGAGRRFSRAHLTMFEGTGDLGAARKAMQYRPRHMQRASKEA